MRFIPRGELIHNIPEGTILWRPVGENGSPVDVKFKPGENGTYLTWVTANGSFCNEPECGKLSGIVCFLKELPQEGWSHLRVSRVGTRANCLFAEEAPRRLTNYPLFRQKLKEFFLTSPHKAEEKLRLARKLRVETVPEETRLFLHPAVAGMDRGFFIETV